MARAGPRGRPRSPTATPDALDAARRDLAGRIEAHRFFQYVFLRQWLDAQALRQ